jgi:N-dimethylarginine dimethylaminohydrolase
LQRNIVAGATGGSYRRSVTVSLLETPDLLPLASPARARRYLMCPPAAFDVVYSINPWMDLAVPVDRRRAMRQWDELVATYHDLGHDVQVIEPVPGLPDMVFSANSAVVIDGRVLAARFRHRERVPEQAPYRRWFREHGFTRVRNARAVNEGDGDFVVAGPHVLAGWGFRSTRAAHAEAQEFFGRPVISLRLTDPRFYHLDIALCALDEQTVAYYPGAFSAGSRRALECMFPDAITVDEDDACALGLNAVSDGERVVLPAGADRFARQLHARGFQPVPIDVSEFRKAGGAVKCCTLELRGPVPA